MVCMACVVCVNQNTAAQRIYCVIYLAFINHCYYLKKNPNLQIFIFVIYRKKGNRVRFKKMGSMVEADPGAGLLLHPRSSSPPSAWVCFSTRGPLLHPTAWVCFSTRGPLLRPRPGPAHHAVPARWLAEMKEHAGREGWGEKRWMSLKTGAGPWLGEG